MSFIKSQEEIISRLRRPYQLHVERLTLAWETRADIVAKLLPPPLKPTPRPIALAYFANVPRTSFGEAYQEAGLFVQAEYRGEVGLYCLSMPVSDDMAMALGREALGLPKKIGRISLRRDGATVEGWVERRGVRVCEIRARLTGTFNTDDARDVLLATGEAPRSAVVFSFKHFPAPDRTGFDYPPRLIRRETRFDPASTEIGEVDIVLRRSDLDPWAEVEVVRRLGAVYATGDDIITTGAVVDEVDGMTFLPYAFLKWDVLGEPPVSPGA
jgi:acetoacetate decarboxylase